ncbi:hypothetical protein [Cellulomonas sp. Y8]|uniref:hypothetical protein n=1 Tax=Cellulomonas sp. Y8 TaxID=2591145 RepID=UPI003D7374AE
MSTRRAVTALAALVVVLAALVALVAWFGTRAVVGVNPKAWMNERWDGVSERLVTSLAQLDGVASVEQTSFGALPEFDIKLDAGADEENASGQVQALCSRWAREYPIYSNPGPIEPRCVIELSG